MNINFFEQQDTVTKNLITFIRLRGYSKLSFSKLTGIPRPTIDVILSPSNSNPTTYNTQISKITEVFELPFDYFLRKPIKSLATTSRTHIDSDNQRSPQAKELFDGLDNILDIYGTYLQ
ncbi:hypothetical protein [Paenibacillus sp. FSL L8-0499]|uniref:hypothetical protein n=1 Tax=Paenibacillus sp. FSL L8-0499 TaxID=2975334 RepID=UPI0030FCEB7C